jgi:hypothetical protein
MSYRIVVDTNVLVSAVLNPKGSPAVIIDTVLDGKLFLISSRVVLNEARRVFSYPKLQKLLKKNGVSAKEITDLLEMIEKVALLVPGKLKVSAIESDPADNIFLACAVEGHADFLVSGDHHLTDLGIFQGIPIIAPAEFLKTTK